MKKRISLFALLGLFVIGTYNAVIAQDTNEATKEQVDSSVTEQAVESNNNQNITQESEEKKPGFHQVIKQKFIEGGPGFMGIVLLCLILGLALAIERIIYLNLSTGDTDKLLSDVENALKNGGVDAAKDVCRDTKGPVASIFYQ